MKPSSAVSKVSTLALLALGAFAFTACQTSSGTSSSASSQQESAPAVGQDNDGMPQGGVLDFSKIIGQSESRATSILREGGYTMRVIERDGEELATTKDFRPNRVNVIVRDGKITNTAGFY